MILTERVCFCAPLLVRKPLKFSQNLNYLPTVNRPYYVFSSLEKGRGYKFKFFPELERCNKECNTSKIVSLDLKIKARLSWIVNPYVYFQEY